MSRDTYSVSPIGAVGASRRKGLLLPCLIAFAAGFCIMVIELVAGRLVAGDIGQSLQTWTCVIGVILAGISIGSYVGGRLADRFPSRWLVPSLFAISAGLCVSILPMVGIIGPATSGLVGDPRLWTLRIVTVVFVVFLAPGTALGTISPAVAKWALDRGVATGQTVGSVYAWNTVGSIVGAFVTGFSLVSWFDVGSIVILSAAGLAAVAVVLFAWGMIARESAEAPWRPESSSAEAPTSLLVPVLLVFLSGFCVMVVELAGSRLVAGHIGQSLYTWTSVIGVVLAGISIGNYLGGRLADSFTSRPLVGSLFLIASVACMSTLQSQHVVENATEAWMGIHTPWWFRVLSTVFVAYIGPSVALGMISPAVAKWALDRGLATGRTVGTIYAWNTLGSICGTFATGFLLISWFYVSRLLALTSLTLALVALMFLIPFGRWLGRGLAVAWLAVALLMTGLTVMPPDKFEEVVLACWPVALEPDEAEDEDEDEGNIVEREIDRLRFAASLLSRGEEVNIYDQYDDIYRDTFGYHDESNYYTIQVSDDTVDSNRLDDYELDANGDPSLDSDGNAIIKERKLRQLVLDALIHGYIDMNDYSYIHYEYEHIYATVSHRVLKAARERGEELNVLFLGGGSYTFPRYLSEVYDHRIHCDVAEIDPEVTRTIQRSMGMNLVNGKSVYLLTDEVPDEEAAAADAERLAPARAGFHFDVRAFVDALNPRRSKAEIAERYAYLLEMSGAVRADTVSADLDYFLDAREDRSAPSSERRHAERLEKVQIIDRDGFEKLLETSPHPNIVTTHGDARQFVMQKVNQSEAAKYQVIYGDAFNDFSVPAHLTTLEFNVELAKLLTDDGIFMANIIDIWTVSKFMGAYRNTLEKVFKHVYLLSTDDGDPGFDRSTFILVCSNRPMDLTDLGNRPEDLKGLVGALMEGRVLEPVIRGGLKPLTTVTMIADGKRTEFELPRTCHDVAVETPAGSRYKLDPAKYELRSANGQTTLDMLEALDEHDELAVTMVDAAGKPLGTDHYTAVDETLVLPVACDRAEVMVTTAHKRPFVGLPEPSYSLRDGKTLVFEKPPYDGATLRITLYGDEPIILTDAYCPVDNMLAEVVATRRED